MPLIMIHHVMHVPIPHLVREVLSQRISHHPALGDVIRINLIKIDIFRTHHAVERIKSTEYKFRESNTQESIERWGWGAGNHSHTEPSALPTPDPQPHRHRTLSDIFADYHDIDVLGMTRAIFRVRPSSSGHWLSLGDLRLPICIFTV
jgi:hypothetical protein